MRLEGKVALITGAASGIGEATAGLFAKEGAKVVVSDVQETGGKTVCKAIEESGGTAMFIRLDVGKENNWVSAVTDTVRHYGKLDILINNASVYSVVPVENTELHEWDQIMSINARGVFLGTRHSIPAMRLAGGGSIVNISSTTSVVGSSRGSVYGASKGAINSLTKFTAVQHATDGIRANSILPGPVDTSMISININTPEGRLASISRVPLGRLGTTYDVARGALFLASEESSFITGTELVIDGGLTAQ